MSNYPYLSDKKFLKELDLENHKIQYIRILVLDFLTEQTIAEIDGKATGGTINLNGSSAMRRTASCSLIADPQGIKQVGYENPQTYSNIMEINNLISLNKKIKLETGFVNSLKWKGVSYYSDHEIIWFPLGTYVIKNAQVSMNSSGINISLTLNDKTALLNGEIGGTIPAAVIFSESELFNATGTQRETEKVLIKNIIRDLLIEYGGEDPERVIIEDIPEVITKIVKWNGSTPVYFNTSDVDLELHESVDCITYQPGEDVGVMVEPFVYPGVLECKAGDTVSAMLDKIKNTLGNYEWFYDINGYFHFQEIKNYINTTPTKELLTSISENDYLLSPQGVLAYIFDEDNKKLLTSISNNPQYNNIKNDFIIWGQTKTASGAVKPIKYHLAFDKKPPIDINKKRLGIIYTSYNNTQQYLALTNNNWKYFKSQKELLNYSGDFNSNNYYLIRTWK